MPITFKLQTVKSVPRLWWSAPHALTLRSPFRSFLGLVFGLIFYGLGKALLVAAVIGVSPWTVLAEGIVKTADLSLGITTFLISLSVLILRIPLRQTQGLGTLLNALIIAFILDLSLPYPPRSEDLLLQIILAFLGVFTTELGGAIYLIANLGPGPRDGLMTWVHALSSRPVALVRSVLEAMLVLAGFSLGGALGLGTLFFALGIGPAIAFCVSVLSRLFTQLTDSGLGAFGIFHQLCVHNDIFILRNKGRYHHLHAVIQNRRFETICRCLTFNYRFCFSHLAHHFLRQRRV